jgi:hypothetical protein
MDSRSSIIDFQAVEDTFDGRLFCHQHEWLTISYVRTSLQAPRLCYRKGLLDDASFIRPRLANGQHSSDIPFWVVVVVVRDMEINQADSDGHTLRSLHWLHLQKCFLWNSSAIGVEWPAAKPMRYELYLRVRFWCHSVWSLRDSLTTYQGMCKLLQRCF